MAVREAVGADHRLIVEMLLASYGPYASALPPELFVGYLSDLVDLDRHAGRGRLLVAESEGRVVGFVAFYPDIALQGVGWPRGWAGGRALAVDPAAQGLGVAHALVAACLELAVDADAPVFAFHTAAFMSRAVALYEGLGFERAPEFDVDLGHFFGSPDDPTTRPAIAFRRNLAVVTSPRRTPPRKEAP